VRREKLRGAFFLGGAALLGAALCVLCLTPPAALAAHLPKGFDLAPCLRFNNLYHVAGYFGLSLLIMLGLGPGNRSRSVMALAVSLALGGIIELLQNGISCHQTSGADFGLNAPGAFTAVGLCRLIERRAPV